jgi:hypothetical protein
MGGVGSFEKECRTLYVGGLSIRSGLEKVLKTEFEEWGELEEVKIIPRLHIAFITYKCRLNAEFAKVWMALLLKVMICICIIYLLFVHRLQCQINSWMGEKC